VSVARQFIAWNVSKKGNRPVGDGVSRATRCVDRHRVEERPVDLIIPFPTGRLAFFCAFQAINCLATIIKSRTDRDSQHLSTNSAPHHSSIFEHEDDDEDEMRPTARYPTTFRADEYGQSRPIASDRMASAIVIVSPQSSLSADQPPTTLR